MAKINKALDYNKLLNDQAKGKLLKKHIEFPLYAGIKYDGNYTVVIKEVQGLTPIFITSGGHIYDNDTPTIFELPTIPSGMVYFAERIGLTGQLGDRVNCSLKGPRGKQTAQGHKYKVHDMVSIIEYEAGLSIQPYRIRRLNVRETFDSTQSWARDTPIHTMAELKIYLGEVVNRRFEGLMLKQPSWYWKDTKSRTVAMAKYKTRPTVDLYCFDVEEGKGKYVGMIGALGLIDSMGREVWVGSGLSDEERNSHPDYFVGEVIEVEYEQIIDTYIQPTYIQRREDKTKEDID